MWLPVFLASYTTRRPLAAPSAGLVPTTAGGERLAAWPGSLAPAAARSRDTVQCGGLTRVWDG